MSTPTPPDSMKLNYILGIDMGVASIGWSVVSLEKRFIDSGVRVFPAGVDNFNSPKEKHPNIDRRDARSMRRRIKRKAQRKAIICQHLQEIGWMPSDASDLQQWHAQDVYELRSRAISEQISLSELGRIILHLNQRRGFLSLRKSEEANADKETQGMLGAISQLQKEIDASGHRTLGNYLYQLYQKEGITTRLRNRHTRRSMLHDEFSLIWETQQQYHPALTKQLRYGSTGPLENPTSVTVPIPRDQKQSLLEQFGFENLTFFQRKVYWPESSIGRCELESEERRCPIADRRFQEFRLLQEVNNLRLIDDSARGLPVERSLSELEREIVIEYLSGRKEVKIEALKKFLCKHHSLKSNFPDSPDQFSFNLEAGGRTKLSSTATDALLSSKKAYGKDWLALNENIKNRVVEILSSPDFTDEEASGDLVQITELDPAKTENFLKVSLPTGYGHLSIKALDKLLPHMRAGKIYQGRDAEDSALHAAGYSRHDEEAIRIVKSLPSFQSLLDSKSPDYDPHQVEINNPVVLRSLTELRKVVNAIIRKYGTPSRINLEMVRALKMSPRQRSEYQKRTRLFETERAESAHELEQIGIIPNRAAINLYRLWQEQREICVYSGRPITITDLFNGDIDVDHIYPESKSADDSMANKVICFATANRTKGNRTPFQWLAQTEPAQYEQVLQRAKKLPHGKYRRFIAQEIPEGFVNRDLNDTAWMSRAAHQYLARLFPAPHFILCIKGQHTAILRDQWELHSLLRSDDLNLKNRDDHRHHALDAIVIALCDQPLLQEICARLEHRLRCQDAREKGMKIYRSKVLGQPIPPPWESFRADVGQSLNSIWVSHRPRKKISGRLHKDTNYGRNAAGHLVIRKSVQSLSAKEINGICDPSIQSLIKQYISAHGDDPKSLSQIPPESPLRMPSGIPIRKVRTAGPYAHLTIRPNTPHETYVQSAATHHLAIFLAKNGKHIFVPVSLMEVARRHKQHLPIVQKHHPDADFLFHLCTGDSLLATIKGKDELFIFNGVHAVDLTAKFVHHFDATRNHKDPDIDDKILKFNEALKEYKDGRLDSTPSKPVASLERFCKASTFTDNFPNPRKVTILPTGEVRNAK